MSDSLKIKIKEKFGTISKFCRCANIDRYNTQKIFAAYKKNPKGWEEEIKLLENTYEYTNPCNDEDEITQELKTQIWRKIEQKGGVVTFVRNHPKFKESSIFQILSGRRKRRTKKVNELLDTLKIKTMNKEKHESMILDIVKNKLINTGIFTVDINTGIYHLTISPDEWHNIFKTKK